jgi:hypothetical protein
MFCNGGARIGTFESWIWLSDSTQVPDTDTSYCHKCKPPCYARVDINRACIEVYSCKKIRKWKNLLLCAGLFYMRIHNWGTARPTFSSFEPVVTSCNYGFFESHRLLGTDLSYYRETVNNSLNCWCTNAEFNAIVDSYLWINAECECNPAIYGWMQEFKRNCWQCEISSSHGGEYDVQNCLLGCTAV